MVELFNDLHNVNATFSLFYILHIHRHTSHAMDVRVGIQYIQQILLFCFRLAFNYAKTDRPNMTPKLQTTFGDMKTRVKNNTIRTRFQRTCIFC